MSQGGIEEPYTIAALPKPLDRANGRILAAPVYSLKASKKRKRHEVAVGIDGETLNIYNIRTQSTTTSYALPPQTYLAAAPCSFYCKSLRTRSSIRRTFVAVREGPRDQKAKLLCFAENHGRATEAQESRAIHKQECRLQHGDVFKIEPWFHDETLVRKEETKAVASLLVTYRDGAIDCFTEDLSRKEWEQQPANGHDGFIEYSSLIDSPSVAQGLLKNREDVLALMSSTGADSASALSAPLLCQVVRSGNARTVRLSLIMPRTSHGLSPRTSTLMEVLQYQLPNQSSLSASYDLHGSSGLLYEHYGRQLRVYDLTGTTPRIVFELGRVKSTLVNSFLRISSACLLTFSDDTASVYETKYGATLGSITLGTSSLANDSSTTDTSRTNRSASQSFETIASFADLGLVVALHGNSIVAMQVSEATASQKHQSREATALADVMGKGSAGPGFDVVDPSKKQEKKQLRWETWRQRVDDLVQRDDFTELEEFIAKDLDLQARVKQQQPNGKPLTNGHTNGHSEDENDLWDLPFTAYDPLHVDSKKANYILGQAFIWHQATELDTAEPHRLELKIRSRNVIRWLGRMGLLTASRVKQIMRRSEARNNDLRVLPGDIMAAVGRIDHSFLMTCDLMALPVHWDLAEIMQGLRTLISSLEDPAPPVEDDMDMTDGDVNKKIELEEAAADRDLQHLMTMFETGPSQRSEALRMLIARLQAFPLRDVTKAMRETLSQNQIIFLIRVLLIELYEGGWTSLYVRTEQEEPAEDDLDTPDLVTDGNHNICTIANLLICVVDAIGTSGWLIGLTGISEDIIERLRVQISAAVTGCLEAQNVQLYLNEILRASNNQQPRKRKRKPEIEMPLTEEENMLPLGAVVENANIKTKGRKKHAASTEMKGKYAFERLRW